MISETYSVVKSLFFSVSLPAPKSHDDSDLPFGTSLLLKVIFFLESLVLFRWYIGVEA